MIPELHTSITDRQLKLMIRNGKIGLAGNRKLKIYGKLGCVSGKRMKRENRIFFEREPEALTLGYRPCGHCMPAAFKKWKHGAI